MLDLLIRNGRVVDPSRNVDAVMDLGAADGRMVPLSAGAADAAQIVDATGCLVLPGLIDFHTHSFYGGNPDSVLPDFMAATGVTATVDAGSFGWANCRAFRDGVVRRSRVKVKGYLGYSDFGVDFPYECYDAGKVREREIRKAFAAFGECLAGIKIRLMRGLADSVEPLRNLVRLAGEMGVAVCVHPTNPPCPTEEIVGLLRPGDVFCHMYHGTGDTILDASGKVKKEVRRARERGVLFDVANGRSNFSFAVARAALADGFPPDIVSTDMTSDKFHCNRCARSLPHVMDKMLAMGMELPDLIRAVTEAPARAMGMAGRIGALGPGAAADIAVFELRDRKARHLDSLGEEFETGRMFQVRMTVIDGAAAFRQPDF